MQPRPCPTPIARRPRHGRLQCRLARSARDVRTAHGGAGRDGRGLLALGTIGLAVTESVGPWYSFRWTLDTIATVGGFRQPHSAAGQIVLVGLIVLGVGSSSCAGHGCGLLRRRSPRRPAGRSAHAEDDRLAQRPPHHLRVRPRRTPGGPRSACRCAEYVVVDSSAERPSPGRRRGHALRRGRIGADEAVLLQAGIARARSIIACADSDANNVFITLTARELRADIPIVARAAVETPRRSSSGPGPIA